MRKIKFRGKRKDNNQWIYGQLICKRHIFDNGMVEIYLKTYEDNYAYIYEDNYENDIEEYPTKFIEVNLNSIGQYTGLQAKNGTEIYEGDIVKFDYYEGLTGTVEEHIVEIQDFWELAPYSKNDIIDLQIIGNIYEEVK